MSNPVANGATRKTVAKAMQILRAFSNDEPELTVGVLSERLGVHKSVVSRLVSSLCEWQMLERDTRTRRIRLGMGAFQLGMLVANQNPLHRLALPLLGNLAASMRHTAHVSVRDGGDMLVVATVESPDALRVILRLGDRRPLHATAGGKVMLAFMPDAERDAIISSRLMQMTDATVTSSAALRKVLTKVRTEGVAWNEGESVVGAGAVAAPVFGVDGVVVGSVSAVFPLNIVDATHRPDLSNAVRATATSLSVALGWTAR